MKKQLSAYKIYWAIAKPNKGIATKKEGTRFAKQGWYRIHLTIKGKVISVFVRHSGNLSTLKSKFSVKGLAKTYSVLTITDKQFGMIRDWNYMDVATSMQKSNMATI